MVVTIGWKRGPSVCACRNTIIKEFTGWKSVVITIIPWPGRYSLMRTWFGFLSAGNMPTSETLSTCRRSHCRQKLKQVLDFKVQWGFNCVCIHLAVAQQSCLLGEAVLPSFGDVSLTAASTLVLERSAPGWSSIAPQSRWWIQECRKLKQAPGNSSEINIKHIKTVHKYISKREQNRLHGFDPLF